MRCVKILTLMGLLSFVATAAIAQEQILFYQKTPGPTVSYPGSNHFFKLQIPCTMDYNKVNNMVSRIANNLLISNESVQDKSAILIPANYNHLAVVGFINDQTHKVYWLAMYPKGQTASYYMKSDDGIVRTSSEWVSFGVQPWGEKEPLMVILAGADDDHGHVTLGWRWDRTDRDWDHS